MIWLYAVVSCAAGALVFIVLITLLHRPACREGSGSRDEHRRRPRLRARGEFEVYWVDPEGRQGRCRARWLDASETGLGIRTRSRLEPGSLLNLCGPKTRISGTAWVRHCTRAGLSWRVGVELTGSLTAEA